MLHYNVTPRRTAFESHIPWQADLVIDVGKRPNLQFPTNSTDLEQHTGTS